MNVWSLTFITLDTAYWQEEEEYEGYQSSIYNKDEKTTVMVTRKMKGSTDKQVKNVKLKGNACGRTRMRIGSSVSF
jgi:hypothetical protein